ncbi:MAG: CcoQ/FixQ family Cbb3-type cytochrome c oxidase assembly chaperone [Helicobacteraceae bacterium]
MQFQEIVGYLYVFGIVACVIFLYWYIYFLHTDKRRGEDYEKYSRLALDDDRLDKNFIEKNEKRVTND